MFIWSIQIAIISIILIFLVHHLLVFFKDTLTVPKMKDLVNAPAQKYEKIYQTLNQSSSYPSHSPSFSPSLNQSLSSSNIEDLLPTKDYTNIPIIKPDTNSMKNELKNFLKSQQNKEYINKTGFNNNNSTDIFTLDSSLF